MRTLTMNEMQVVSGGTDLPPPVFVYTTDDMINALTSVPFPVGGYEAAYMMYYNFGAAAQFGLATMIWGASNFLSSFF